MVSSRCYNLLFMDSVHRLVGACLSISNVSHNIPTSEIRSQHVVNRLKSKADVLQFTRKAIFISL